MDSDTKNQLFSFRDELDQMFNLPEDKNMLSQMLLDVFTVISSLDMKRKITNWIHDNNGEGLIKRQLDSIALSKEDCEILKEIFPALQKKLEIKIKAITQKKAQDMSEDHNHISKDE